MRACRDHPIHPLLLLDIVSFTKVRTLIDQNPLTHLYARPFLDTGTYTRQYDNSDACQTLLMSRVTATVTMGRLSTHLDSGDDDPYEISSWHIRVLTLLIFDLLWNEQY